MTSDSAGAIRIRTGTVRFDEEQGIVKVSHEPGIVITLNDAKEQIAAVVKLSGGRRLPLLVDMASIKFIEQPARDYFGSPESIVAWCAAALIVGSATSVAVGTMWVAVHGSLEAPSKVFSSEPEAVAWLREHITS